MILAIDCGNTRLKWGLHQEGAWRRTGALPVAEIAQLKTDWNELAAPGKLVVSNVAGGSVRRQLESIFSRWRVSPVWVESKRSECGVTNSYHEPAQLGPDRWAALLGAWSMLRGPCLVVTAGTATTADVLTSSGTFTGGVIFPGLELMKRALAQNTAGLPLAEGRFSGAPCSTADAIETGCLLAQVGAIERMFSGLEPGATCLLSGGAAARIAPQLRIPARVADNLVLEGLLRIAADAPI